MRVTTSSSTVRSWSKKNNPLIPHKNRFRRLGVAGNSALHHVDHFTRDLLPRTGMTPIGNSLAAPGATEGLPQRIAQSRYIAGRHHESVVLRRYHGRHTADMRGHHGSAARQCLVHHVGPAFRIAGKAEDIRGREQFRHAVTVYKTYEPHAFGDA